MQTIRVTQVTEIVITEKYEQEILKGLVDRVKRDGYIDNNLFVFYSGRNVSTKVSISSPNLTISDLEKSGEII